MSSERYPNGDARVPSNRVVRTMIDARAVNAVALVPRALLSTLAAWLRTGKYNVRWALTSITPKADHASTLFWSALFYSLARLLRDCLHSTQLTRTQGAKDTIACSRVPLWMYLVCSLIVPWLWWWWGHGAGHVVTRGENGDLLLGYVVWSC
jgi:hypothetical protein